LTRGLRRQQLSCCERASEQRSDLPPAFVELEQFTVETVFGFLVVRDTPRTARPMKDWFGEGAWTRARARGTSTSFDHCVTKELVSRRRLWVV